VGKQPSKMVSRSVVLAIEVKVVVYLFGEWMYHGIDKANGYDLHSL